MAAMLSSPSSSSSSSSLSSVLQAIFQTDHYQPHRWAKFEGYYSKFDLPSGARLILVICSVPYASSSSAKKHNVTIVYVPKSGLNVWKREFFPEDMKITTTTTAAGRGGFTMGTAVDGGLCARMTTGSSGDGPNSDVVHYEVEHAGEGIKFNAITSKRVPWSSSWFDTPAGPLAWLPLPLHWHVHSLGSQCSYSLTLPAEASVAAEDRQGSAVVHEEKNWANSFPPAHNWIQARKSTGNLCLAGGRTMGVDAFLVGYRNADFNLELDFRPPFALKVLGVSPFMTHRLDWENRTFFLSVQNFSYKLEISAKGKKGTFVALSAPMAEGFKDNYMGQSQNAEIEVTLYKSLGLILGAWQHICTDHFDQASLEFGALYYPPRGSGETLH